MTRFNRFFMSFFALLAAVSAWAEDFPVVRDGKAAATVVTASPKCEKWAAELVDFVEKSTGAKLPVAAQADGPAVRLEIAPDKHADIEEFSFTFPDDRTLLISGGSENGLKFGVYEFLARYLGLRRLFPGPLGDHLPKHTTVTVPRVEVKSAPKYLSRYLGSGAYTPATKDYYDWSRSLGANNPRLWMGHFLYQLLPVEKYGKDHPEFYPFFNGRRVLPAPGQATAWQPCFTAPGAAEEAARNAIAKLEQTRMRGGENPRRFTVSLGINDASGFCECDACHKANGTRVNYVGRPDASGSYIPFLTRAADLITARFPDTKIGFLAYNNVSELPDGVGKLNPALIPEIDFDSMYLADPERKATFRRVLEKWHTALPEIAVGDYLWGAHYLLPRIYLKSLTEHLRWNYEHGTRHYYAEFYPGAEWTEGPKGYLVLKLLWDPDCDVEALLKDWYECAVGAKAAPFLREYFERLEAFWMNDVRSTEWFKEPRVYSSYGKTDYLEAYKPEALAKSEELLNKTVELAGTPEEKARAEYFRKLFLKRKPLIQAFWTTRAVQAKAAKMDFSVPLLRAGFDKEPKTLPTWKRKNSDAKFFRDETGGIEHSGCLGIDADGAKGAPAIYEARVPVRDKRTFRVSVQCRAEPDVGPGARIALQVYWRDAQNQMLSNTYRVEQKLDPPYDDEWRTLTAYTATPVEGELKLCVGLAINNTNKGKVRFDDLAIDATLPEIPDLEKYTEVVLNHTFDQKPLRWAQWQSGKTGAIRCVRDEKGGRDGSAGLLIDCSQDKERAAGMFIQPLPVKSGQKLLVSGWAKVSDDLGPDALVRFSADCRDAAGKSLGKQSYADYPAARDGKWRELVFPVAVPEGAVKMQLVLAVRRGAPGRVWFDDVTVKAMKEE